VLNARGRDAPALDASANVIMNLFIPGIANGFSVQPFNLPCHILSNRIPVFRQYFFQKIGFFL
jgi:hypothetical protein